MKTMPRDNDFGLLIKNMRERQGITREQLCEGLCTVSMLGKIESGEQYPEKMMRDRLLGRLGAAQDNFENFLNLKEYDKWCERTQVLSGLENERQDVEQLIEEYGVHSGHDALARQMYLDMKGQYIKQWSGEGNEEKLCSIYCAAVEITMPRLLKQCQLENIDDVVNISLSRYCLSVRELNLYVEYLRYALKLNKTSEYDDKGRGVRCFLNIIEYIQTYVYDEKSISKIYPKVVVCLYDEWKETGGIVTALCMLDTCNKAVEYLRTVEKGYYLWEILDIRRNLLADYKSTLVIGDGGVEDAELEELCVQTDNWLSVLEEVYSQYNISYRMTNECYFYQENNVYCINDVIRNRRRMLGLSRAKLCNGICAEKTLVAIEGKKCNPQRQIVKELFERLGLPMQFQWAGIVTTDYEDILLKESIVHCSRAGRHIKSLKLLKKLKEHLPDNRVNKQWIERQEIIIQQYLNNNQYETVIDNLKEVLAYTIPFEEVYQLIKESKKRLNNFEKTSRIYLTETEVLCFFSIGNYYSKNKLYECAENIFNFLYNYYDINNADGRIRSYISMYEVIIASLCSLLGDRGVFEVSDDLSDSIMEASLRLHRTGELHLNIYNNAWNYMTQTGDKLKIKEQLRKCIFLSQISKAESYECRYKKRISIH